MVIVDEAWGGHLRFHPDLPESAMAAGADVCVQSTHKPAGGLQQTGLLHWREGRVDTELMEEAYREYVTASPSYHLLASADAAVPTLAACGEEALGRAIERTDELKAGLRERLPDLDWMDDAAWLRSVRAHAPGWDLVRTTIGPSRYRLSGYEVARALVDRGVVIEKAGVQTITLIATFQLADSAVAETVDALVGVLGDAVLPGGRREGPDGQPVRRDRRPSGDAPVIPVILEGFRVSADAVEYLLDARDKGGSIVARDTSLATLRVL